MVRAVGWAHLLPAAREAVSAANGRPRRVVCERIHGLPPLARGQNALGRAAGAAILTALPTIGGCVDAMIRPADGTPAGLESDRHFVVTLEHG